MKKETRYCDVCGEEVLPLIDYYVANPDSPQRHFCVQIFENQLGINLCDRDRLRVLEAAVEQMKVTA